jgi:hypothetical protein
VDVSGWVVSAGDEELSGLLERVVVVEQAPTGRQVGRGGVAEDNLVVGVDDEDTVVARSAISR